MKIVINTKTEPKVVAFIHKISGAVYNLDSRGEFYCILLRRKAEVDELVRNGFVPMYKGDKVTLEF